MVGMPRRSKIVSRTNALVIGIDLSADMLARAQHNVRLSRLDARILLVRGQAERLPFKDASFDALTFTYLLRYVADPASTIAELARVVRPGGTISSLEFAVPSNPFWRLAWTCYTRVVLPAGGALLGGRAWFEVGKFLGPNIVGHYQLFSEADTVDAWRAAGVSNVQVRRMSLGGGIVMWGQRDLHSPGLENE